MTKEERTIINFIVNKRGDCCTANNCINCPFISDCAKNMMRDYKYSSTNAKAIRVAKALGVCTRKILVGDDR